MSSQKKELTIHPIATNTQSSSSQSSSIKCVSPNVVTGSNKSYVVFEAIYYENGTNGVQNQPNQLVLAKVKNNHINADAKSNVTMKNNDTNVAAPILVTSVSSPLTSVLQFNNNNNNNNKNHNTPSTIVKKPGIILLTQTSLSKLLSASDLNLINNNANSNTNIVNHAHFHQPDNSNRSKCNITINTTTTNPTSVSTQINNQLQSVLMINSSTIETTAGVVTLTSTTAPNRDAKDEITRANNQQVKKY